MQESRVDRRSEQEERATNLAGRVGGGQRTWVTLQTASHALALATPAWGWGLGALNLGLCTWGLEFGAWGLGPEIRGVVRRSRAQIESLGLSRRMMGFSPNLAAIFISSISSSNPAEFPAPPGSTDRFS